jgi:hypothetical protein
VATDTLDGQPIPGAAARPGGLTEAAASHPEAAGEVRPTLIDRLIHLPERLPGPTLIWLLVLGVVLVIVANVVIWLAGDKPYGAIETSTVAPVIFTVYSISLVLYLDWIARSAFVQFQPALRDDSEPRAWQARLTSIPSRPAFAAIALLELVITLGYFSDPRTQAAWDLVAPSVRVVTLIEYWTAVAALAVLIVHTIRQLRAVSQLHAAAKAVDLFEPGPLTAFSRLTAATAVGILVIAVPFTFPLEINFALANAIGFMLLAGASFVLPLNGFHGRLAIERQRLLHEVNGRLRAVTGRLHSDIDRDDLSQATKLRDSLTGLIAERDLILKLSTWPWSTTTFRGIASALLLPILIFVITRLIDQLI